MERGAQLGVSVGLLGPGFYWEKTAHLSGFTGLAVEMFLGIHIQSGL